MRCVGLKKVPKGEWRGHPVSNSKEYIIPGWAAGLWPFWDRVRAWWAVHCQNQPFVVCASKSP